MHSAGARDPLRQGDEGLRTPQKPPPRPRTWTPQEGFRKKPDANGTVRLCGRRDLAQRPYVFVRPALRLAARIHHPPLSYTHAPRPDLDGSRDRVPGPCDSPPPRPGTQPRPPAGSPLLMRPSLEAIRGRPQGAGGAVSPQSLCPQFRPHPVPPFTLPAPFYPKGAEGLCPPSPAPPSLRLLLAIPALPCARRPTPAAAWLLPLPLSRNYANHHH